MIRGLRTVGGYPRALQWHLARARELANGLPLAARTRISMTMALLFTQHRFGVHGSRTYRIPVAGRPAFTVRDHTELLVLWEIFTRQCYDSPALPRHVDVVVDLGCNVGAASFWFRERWPNARTIAVEADGATAALARHNLRGLRDADVIHAAVGTHAGSTTFWEVPRGSWTSSTLGSPGAIPRTVPATTIDALLSLVPDTAVILIKIDIEGAEHEAIAASKDLTRARFIVGEYHPVAPHTYASFARSFSGYAVTPEHASDTAQTDFFAFRTA